MLRVNAATPQSVAEELRAVGAELAGSPLAPEFTEYAGAHAERFAFLLNRMEAPPGQRTLDAGSFPGHMTVLLKRRGHDVTALNQAWDSYASWPAYRALLERLGVPLVTGDLERGHAALASDAFDQVLFTEVVEHLAFDPFHAVAELARVLKPGGTLWLSTPNVACARYVLRLMGGRSIFRPLQEPWAYTFPTAPGARHEREYTARELDVLLNPGARGPHRFDGVHVSTQGWFSDDQPSGRALVRAAERWMVRAVPRLGNALFASARKPRGLHIGRADDLLVSGNAEAPFDPVAEVRPPIPAPFPCPFRWTVGECLLELRVPAGIAVPADLVLPLVWPAFSPPFPEQHVDLVDEGGTVVSTARVAGENNVQWVRFAGAVRGPAGATARLRWMPRNPVRPDAILKNGDVRTLSPAIAATHWAVDAGRQA